MVDAAVNADPARSPASRRRRVAGGPGGEMRPLHDLNPVRLRYVERTAPLAGERSSTSAAAADCWPKRWRARARAWWASTSLRTCCASRSCTRSMPASRSTTGWSRPSSTRPGHADHYDVVTCMEMLEHVPDPAAVVAALAALARPGGEVFVSTLNRTPIAYLKAIWARSTCCDCCPPHAYLREVHPALGTRRLGASVRTHARGRHGSRLRSLCAQREARRGCTRELPGAPAQAGCGPAVG